LSPPVGPTGLPAQCDGSEPATWQVTGSVSGFSTQIKFNDARVDVEQLAVTATIGHFGSPRLGWSASAGGIVAGRVEGRDVSSGATLGGTLSWLPIYEGPGRPFVAGTVSLGGAYARAMADDGMQRSWWAFDLRGGVTVGKTVAERWVPYASARVFAGPVSWRRAGADVTGGDRYHFTVGAGLIVRLPGSVDVTAEAMPLGEQSFALGVTLHL
jgi:hypothetical protein